MSALKTIASNRVGPARRLALVAGLGALLCGATAWARRDCDVCGSTPDDDEEDQLIQPARATPLAFMQLALELADAAGRRGDQAIGAAVVWEGTVIGIGSNRVQSRHDVTG